MAPQRPKDGNLSTSQHNKSFTAVLRGMQFKWTLGLTAIMLVFAIAGDQLIRSSTENLISRQQNAEVLKQCDLLAALSAPALRNADTVGLGQIADSLKAQPTILYVEFFSSSGKLLLQRKYGTVEPPPISQEPAARAVVGLASTTVWHAPRPNNPLFVDVVQPASNPRGPTAPGAAPGPKDVVGYVRLGLDLSSIQAGLAEFLQNIRYAGLLSIVLMIPLTFMLVRRVAAPINELSSVVKQFAGGAFRVRSKISRSDEVGELASAFDSMADELSVSNDNLVKLNAELEDRVLQRTRQLKDLSERDPLTGLYNRRHLNEVLSRRFNEAERYGNDLSCLMIDLDNFKQVNDRFGHEMGDNLLILTGSVITSQLRGADVGARFGGDEFCILLPQTSAEQAQQVGARIVAKFREELDNRLKEHGAQFGISVGVSGMKELELVHHDELMKAADRALYKAKDAGKNCIHLADSLA